MIKKCYFFNVGTIFDKNNLDSLHDVWNYNGNCCKSDLCNGFNCENYGINFNKDKTIKEIEKYVNEGVINTYGYIKSVDVDLPEEIEGAGFKVGEVKEIYLSRFSKKL